MMHQRKRSWRRLKSAPGKLKKRLKKQRKKQRKKRRRCRTSLTAPRWISSLKLFPLAAAVGHRSGSTRLGRQFPDGTWQRRTRYLPGGRRLARRRLSGVDLENADHGGQL